MYQHPIVRLFIVFVALASVTVLVYLPTLHWPLLSDDYDMVWGTGEGRGTWQHGFFRPIAFLSFRVVHELAGDGALPHRLFNLGVHLTNGCLVFLLTRSLLGQSSAAWIVSLLFIVYPFHQEAVVWCVGRYPAMATSFMLSALLVARSELRWSLRSSIVLVCYALAVLTYEIAFCLPVLVLLMVRDRSEALRPWVIGFTGATAILLIARWQVSGTWSNGYLQTLIQHGPVTYLTTVPKAALRLFLPPCEESRQQLLRAFALILSFGLLVRLRWNALHERVAQRRPYLVLSMLLTSLWLAFIGGVSTRTSESDRFLYLPSVFVCILVGLLLTGITHRHWRTGIAIALLIVAFLGLRSNHRNWAIASRISLNTLNALETMQARSPLEVVALPDEYEGAFVFRHGIQTALLLRGIDTSRVRSNMPMARNEMAASGLMDTIELRFERDLPIGRLVPVNGLSVNGRTRYKWAP